MPGFLYVCLFFREKIGIFTVLMNRKEKEKKRRTHEEEV